MFDLAQVDGYFETHLEMAFWNAQDESRRRAAVRMAEYDVTAALGMATVNTADIFQYCAVCEQALHRLHCDDARRALEESAARTGEARLVAEEVDGVGSRRYEYASDSDRDNAASGRSWSDRALAFLSRARPVPVPRMGRG